MKNRRNVLKGRKNEENEFSPARTYTNHEDKDRSASQFRRPNMHRSRLLLFSVGFTSLFLTGSIGYLFLSIDSTSHVRLSSKKANGSTPLKSKQLTTEQTTPFANVVKPQQKAPNEKVITAVGTKDTTEKISTLDKDDNNNDRVPEQQHSVDSNSELANALKQIEDLRNHFYERYGGKDAAETLLAKGVFSFGDKTETDKHMGLRFLRAASKNESVKFSFGGYSVTVGRGNHFSQSYPFVVQSVLNELVLSIFNIHLDVKNAAIGGIPSLPYGWCLRNFFGDDSDLVSWDYGMNEGQTTHALESYLRHSMTLTNKPMFLMLDVNIRRKKILQGYVESGAIVDPVAINKDNLIDFKFLNMKNDQRPEGYQDWEKWGSPPGSPGQSKWHPKYKEHELLGWLIAMHILDGIEAAVHIKHTEHDWESLSNDVKERYLSMEDINLPAPISKDTEKNIATLLYGHVSTSASDDKKWHLNHVSCRTSFLPTVSGDIDSIIVSGVTKVDEDPMASRDDESYSSGWVLDVGKTERDTKRKVEKVGGMGYIDMKLALYGIPESGTLSLWLPYEANPHTHAHEKNNDTYQTASHFFNKLVICEVNEKRKSEFHECEMKSDLSFTIGGEKSDRVSQITSVASYLGKQICVEVEIPPTAKITKRKQMEKSRTHKKSASLGNSVSKKADNDVGLTVDITVTGKDVTRKGGACSISHVIWEHV